MLLSLLDSSVFPWGEILTALGSLITFLIVAANKKLKHLLSETKTNGGKSLRDQINRIETKVTNLAIWWEANNHLSTQAMFRTDPNGNFIWVNNAFISLTGRGMDSLKNMGWISAVHEDDRTRVYQDWINALKDKRPFQSDFTIVTSSGETKEVRARTNPAQDDPIFLGYIGYWLTLEEIGFN